MESEDGSKCNWQSCYKGHTNTPEHVSLTLAMRRRSTIDDSWLRLDHQLWRTSPQIDGRNESSKRAVIEIGRLKQWKTLEQLSGESSRGGAVQILPAHTEIGLESEAGEQRKPRDR